MRTNVILNPDLIREASQYSKTKSKTALIEEALLTFVRVKAEEKKRASYASQVQALHTRTDDMKLRESVRNILRNDRSRDD